jgi:isoquinoline 1-oxidoreductase subunit alpha
MRRTAIDLKAPPGQPATSPTLTDTALPSALLRMNRTLTVNQRRRPVAAAPDTPLLWVLREELGLTGTKFGCGVAHCGACTVHLSGQPVRSCVLPLQAVGTQPVTTIEGLASQQGKALQAAWLEHQVAQCGYCQSGMLMAASALLAQNARPSDADIDAAITNLCRCGTYPRVRAAIHHAARELAAGAPA